MALKQQKGLQGQEFLDMGCLKIFWVKRQKRRGGIGVQHGEKHAKQVWGKIDFKKSSYLRKTRENLWLSLKKPRICNNNIIIIIILSK